MTKTFFPAHILAATIILSVLLAACGAGSVTPSQTTANAAPIPAVSIQPPEVPIDQPVSIRLSGFAPNQEVTIRATTVGAAFPNLSDTGNVFESFATFRTDAQGALDLEKQAPLSGSYDKVDGMGLFWSLTQKPPKPVQRPLPRLQPHPIW
jgi:Acyl-CoA thioester hydrolase/BAAT N-terminal region